MVFFIIEFASHAGIEPGTSKWLSYSARVVWPWGVKIHRPSDFSIRITPIEPKAQHTA